jgi:MoxR-like ATPase
MSIARRSACGDVFAPPTVVSYAVRLARSTRPDAPEATPNVKKYVSWGAGPRAS